MNITKEQIYKYMKHERDDSKESYCRQSPFCCDDCRRHGLGIKQINCRCSHGVFNELQKEFGVADQIEELLEIL